MGELVNPRRNFPINQHEFIILEGGENFQFIKCFMYLPTAPRLNGTLASRAVSFSRRVSSLQEMRGS